MMDDNLIARFKKLAALHQALAREQQRYMRRILAAFGR